MAINLGNASEQKEVVAGPIPRKSLVKVKMEIRQPKKADDQDPAVTIFKSGLKGLDCVFTVVSGTYEGLQMWENWFLPPDLQNIQLTSGQEGACNGSFAKCRAVIEAARRLDPADATANRNINSWFDLHGLEFPIKVGIQKPKPGDIYINNSISKILLPGDPDFDRIMGGGEMITDEPIPAIPEGGKTGAKPGDKPAWSQGGGQGGQAPTQQTQQPAQTQQGQQKVNVPAWAQGGK